MYKSVADLQKKYEELKKKYFNNENDEVIEECKNILKKNKIDVFYNLLCLAYNNKGNILKADAIVYDKSKGLVEAEGNVVLVLGDQP